MSDQIEIAKFKQEKLNGFNLQHDSRPSDPENPDIFRPTFGNFRENDHSYEHEDKSRNFTHEGVDEYDDETHGGRSMVNGKLKRTSLAEKYDFEGI